MNYIKAISINRDDGCPCGYPFNLPAIEVLSRIELEAPVTFLVGENGAGKSTLLEAIAIAYGFNPEGGSKNYNFATCDSHSELHDYIKLTKGLRSRDSFFLRAESFYNVATYVDSNPDAFLAMGGSLHRQSHGESFLTLMMNRFFGNGMYILDEPEAALSPNRQLTILATIDELVKRNSQFIIATHSPILLAYPNAQIYVMSDSGIHLTPYEQTEHYIITRQFLNNPVNIMNKLLK